MTFILFWKWVQEFNHPVLRNGLGMRKLFYLGVKNGPKGNENTMDGESDYILSKEKAKLQIGIGCFFGVVILGLLIILIPIWLLFSLSDETRLKISHSPNNVNTIEIVKKDDFPDPTIRIKYENKSIMKTKIPDNISVQWDNDFEAIVILYKQGKDPGIVEIKFK